MNQAIDYSVLSSKIGLIQFPGSNCDMDCADILQRHFGISVTLIWHTETKLPKVDGVIIPGGFSYGDYLRSGGLAAHAHIMDDVKAFAKKGGAVIGICNGFQILTEAGLLPGALLKNLSRKFICHHVYLTAAKGSSSYHEQFKGCRFSNPIAHGDGRYYISDDGLKELEDHDQIVFRYSDKEGEITEEANPNGSVGNIAGIVSKNGRVLGMMPHPERAADDLLSLVDGANHDGLKIWSAFLSSCL